MEYFCIALIMY